MQTIYLIAHDWHTGFVLPAHDIYLRLPDLETRFPQADYLEFGWGDRQYFQSENSALAAKLCAVLIPGASTMHVVAMPEVSAPHTDAEPIIPLLLSASAYQALIDFLVKSFYQTPEGNLVQQIHGRYANSQFYQANGLYHLLNTCNKWTATGLRAASIDIQPRFKLSAESVLREITKNGYEKT